MVKQYKTSEAARKAKLAWYHRNKQYYRKRYANEKEDPNIRIRWNDRQKKWKSAKYKSDPSYKLIVNLRVRMRKAIKGIHKFHHMKEIIGLDKDDFKAHIEKQWSDGMKWDNYGRGGGKWGIDHIMPCSAFDMLSAEGQHACFHFENLRPLWHVENSSKGNRIM
jgi:hypothetical protein